MLNATVGKNIKKLRVMNNYSQDVVEIALNISRSTLSKIENGSGRIDLDRLEKFAKFFKVSPVTLIALGEKKDYEIVDSNLRDHATEEKIDYTKTDLELAKCKEKITSIKKEVTHLKTELQTARSQIKDKDKIIDLLSAS